MQKAVFTIDTDPKAYIGYTSGKLWNGWATPYFEKEEAIRVMHDYNSSRDVSEHMSYDEENDMFIAWCEGYNDYEYWTGEDIRTTEGIKHLYGIGAYSWIWDNALDWDSYHLAEGIENFIYEFDTYEAKDQYADREEMLKAIQEQLKEVTTFQQVYEIWQNEELTEEARFNKLGGILKL